MNFALLLSHLPNTHESRAHYESLLSLDPVRPNRLAAFWRRLGSLFS
ncbi:hypothetical protein [Paraburkholderia antibiotica]|uniref:Uncharacterized protein n=1 Tax=Paraburkholderia antibiotica TaxID=2728839 RepID=A0A7X9X7N0_9BURK|nr:hypothetical protein [Paraburkholderia antibiotica]NML32838.1 hypothetical protein [Paraburkholderia antibiotica]